MNRTLASQFWIRNNKYIYTCTLEGKKQPPAQSLLHSMKSCMNKGSQENNEEKKLSLKTRISLEAQHHQNVKTLYAELHLIPQKHKLNYKLVFCVLSQLSCHAKFHFCRYFLLGMIIKPTQISLAWPFCTGFSDARYREHRTFLADIGLISLTCLILLAISDWLTLKHIDCW